MVKLASRDILGVLRRYDIADDTNVPRHITNIKYYHPSAHNTLASFVFMNQQFYLLEDVSVEDNTDTVISEIKKVDSNITGEIVKNCRDETTTYAVPIKGKEFYLFQKISYKKRLDADLAEKNPEYSRSTWQKYIKAGYVTVNNKPELSIKKDITAKDIIEFNVPKANDFTEQTLPIIYLDDNVIVINKPAGILSHSKGALNDEFSVATFFKRYCDYNAETNRPGIVHRLDRDTSGIMIGARNNETARMLQKQFSDRKTKKTYIAIVEGYPKLDKANIDLPINRNPTKPSMFRVDANGKTAFTTYEVIAKNNKNSLVKLQPRTGRTHQLRVHMAYINNPIIGDKVYGRENTRMFLHALSLEITIPKGDRRVFEAPLPDEFVKDFDNIEL